MRFSSVYCEASASARPPAPSPAISGVTGMPIESAALSRIQETMMNVSTLPPSRMSWLSIASGRMP